MLGDECALTEVYTYTLTDGCGNVSEDYVLGCRLWTTKRLCFKRHSKA